MAKMRDRKPKDSSGGYGRVLGNDDLDVLISKVQGTVISSGTELERMIAARVKKVEDLDEFLNQEIMEDGVVLATKKQIKKCTTFDCAQSEPDFIIFKRRNNEQACYVVELKDGHAFDTKKASAERDVLHKFTAQHGVNIAYKFHIHIVCFNQDSKDAIVKGFKNKISEEEAMTGREFCELLEIDYDEIVEARKADQQDNIEYFAEELVSIPAMRELLVKFLQG